MPPVKATINVLQGARQFFTGKRKQEKIDRGRYIQTPQSPVGPSTAQVPSPTCRRSIFGLNGFGNFGTLPKPKRGGEVEMTAQMVVEYQSELRKQTVNPADERKRCLHDEIDELNKDVSRLNGRIGRRRAKLEGLKARDQEEKWEDDLFETRARELRNAQALAHTQSTVSEADVLRQIDELNEDIGDIASLAAETSTLTNARQGGREVVQDVLGEKLLGMLQRAGNVWDDKKLVQAILQVVLVRSCARLINSWHLGNSNLNDYLDRLYERIFCNEEQLVVGKWRQITLEQLPRAPRTEVFEQFVSQTAAGILGIASFAGWGGDARRVQKRVRQLMERAEEIRVNVKSVITSADLQPVVATCGELYDRSRMKDVSHRFGMERVEDHKRLHVLGSISLGLKVRKTEREEDPTFEDSECRTRVLLIEPLVARRRWTGR